LNLSAKLSIIWLHIEEDRLPESKIKILSEGAINKIAAGEVIDRPASVVKELIENSIDAGADEITVLLKQGGQSLIQVVDNGIGMDEQDAILSFQRHATSKIRDFKDIEKIVTLGFRGEALASIASVARVEMKTIQMNQIEGTLLQINGGIVSKVGKTGGNPGTSIAVKNLFYNTPARRKFLRTDSTEYRHILNILNRFTLAYPQIHFTLIHEEHQIYSLAKSDLKGRVADVLGKNIADHLLPINEENAVFTCSGLLGDFDLIRKSRDEQYFFVNQRFINDRTLAAAVISGYGELLPKGRFPVYLLFFTIDPARIDVNVHPTKSEIKFADQQILFALIRGAVKRTLHQDHIVPDVRLDSQTADTRPLARFRPAIKQEIGRHQTQQASIDFNNAAERLYGRELIPSESMDEGVGSSETRLQDEDPWKIWQAHNKYILSQIKSGIVLIDQHAAHERITYERIKSGFRNKDAASQQLLFPHTIDLSVGDFALLMDILPFLEKIGFIIKGFGGRTVVIEGVPVGLRIRKEEKILTEILDEYKMKMGEVDVQERVAKSIACRASIMSGDRLSREEMLSLIDQLFACEVPYFCPHGRPTMITLSLEELDNRFERM